MRAMQSNNPVFQRSETLARAAQSSYGFHPAPSADEVAGIYGTPQRMTMDDVIVKTGILLAIVVGVGAVSWVAGVPLGIGALAALVGFGLAMVNIFKKQVSPGLVMAYAAAQGVFLGTISASYNGQYRGIVVQAVVGTAAVFGAVLMGYKSGRLRATPKFRKVVTFGLIGLVARMQQSGLGDVVKSWISSGDNLPVSPDQLGGVLGHDTVTNMAGQLGMNHGDLLSQLSQMLPQVVDKLTPQGQIPHGDVAGMLGGLLGGQGGQGSGQNGGLGDLAGMLSGLLNKR